MCEKLEERGQGSKLIVQRTNLKEKCCYVSDTKLSYLLYKPELESPSPSAHLITEGGNVP